ncbi:MAG TPA: TetR/AcrR family transcriptional regulator [Thiolapillus brandeum]|uniref:TetR/AcrR family transcriptional regulator n=1 Tax=Thiolapillus brandeum TaxID=1076588 RepID=A0A831RUY6_9GAMM|nr:TetR/AcrR family transcriptional regulator [Thiolapillus brandeum]
MARRNDHSRDEIKEMALAAAEKIISTEGAKGMSARKVAAAIGYTVGTLYLVFDNLDDLILHINARTLDRLHDLMLEEQAGHSDPMARLLQLGHSYIRFADREPHRWELVFEHRLPEGQQPPDWFREKVARMFALVEASLEPLAANRSADEIKQAAAALWSGVHGICILAISKQLDVAGVDSVQDLTHSLMSHYLKGFVGCNF